MVKHNIKVAVRNLLKYKLQTVVSILSLALGMVFFSLTTLWLRQERNYDSFHRDVENIYLEVRKKYADNNYDAYMFFSELENQAAKYPQIESWARNGIQKKCHFYDGDQQIDEITGMMVDDNYQDFFDVKILSGGDRLVLQGNEIAITESCAKRFYDGDALGKQLNNGFDILDIKYVIEDPRQPSVFRYDYLSAFNERDKDGGVYSTYGFLRVTPENLASLSTWLENDTVSQSYTYTDAMGQEKTFSYYKVENFKLIPMKEIRNYDYLDYVPVKSKYVWFFMILSIIMIICALVNYYTMLVTRMGIRVREISLRFANGASMLQVVGLFATEIVMLLVLALFIGAIICEIGLPYFIDLCGIDRSAGFFILSYLLYSFSVGVLSLVAATGIISVVSRRNLSKSLGNNKGTHSSAGYRVSIGLQLAISICVIFCSVVMTAQIVFMTGSREMGFDKRNLGILYHIGMNASEVDAVKAELRKIPEIDMFTYGFRDPIADYHSYSSISLSQEESEESEVDYVSIDANRSYLDLIGVQLIAGSLFAPESEDPIHEREVIINETFTRKLGMNPTEIIGKEIGLIGWKIIGVVKDLSYLEPTTEVSPLMYHYSRDSEVHGTSYSGSFLFRYNSNTRWPEIEEKLNGAVQSVKPSSYYYDVHRIMDEYMEYISSEVALCTFLLVVTLICIIIAISGVFSIVSLACERRRKEIAIRKISGAKPADIVRLFMKEYMLVLAAASVIAFPVGYVLMKSWLSVYVKQVSVSAWMFLGILLFMSLLMTATIIGHITGASRQDPVQVIKSE